MRTREAGGVGRAAGAPRRFNLRSLYYVAALVLAALVPMILFAGLWLRSELRKDQRDLDALVSGRAAALLQRIDGEVGQNFAALRAVAALPSLDEPDLASFHAQAVRMVPAMGWAALALHEPQAGRQILNTLRPLGAELPGLDADTARRVAQARRAAAETRDPSPDGLYSERRILLYVPVVRNGAVRHVLSAALGANFVEELLASEVGDSRLLAAIIDERGQVLARSPQANPSQPADKAVPNSATRGSAPVIASPVLGEEMVNSASERSVATGWTALVGIDAHQLEGLSRPSRWAIAGTGALSLTLAGVLAVFLLYNLMEGRLGEERLAASRALGDLDARLLSTMQDALEEQRKAASEREVLLREIYHRVKNNLQIIQSLLRLGSRDLAAAEREPFEDAIRRIGAMARVHTLLYNSPDLASIDLGAYLDGLVTEISDAYGAEQRGIRTILDAKPMRVSLETAVPLAFIAVEILTNAFKHAFPPGRAGTVKVAAGRDGASGILSISDDGVGIPANTQGRRSLGLTIVAKLVQQIGGRLEQPEPGRATFRVTFPIGEEESQAGTTPEAPPLVQAAPARHIA